MFVAHSNAAPWIGLVGDTVTVVGAIFLALDAAHEAKQRREVQKIGSLAREMREHHITMKVKGTVVRDYEGVEYAYIRRSSWRALLATIALFVGFCFLLAARIAEIVR